MVFPALLALALLHVPTTPGQVVNADPALGVARISLVSGDVATQRGDSGDWIAADVNMPLVEGDSIQAGGGSKAEVQLARGNFVRLGSDTEVRFLELGTKQFRVQVLSGKAIYSELEGSEADIDIEAPFVAVRPMRAGRYKVAVTEASTIIEVRRGETEIAFQHSTSTLEKGQSLTVWKESDEVKFEIGRVGPRESLDKWAERRDRTLRQAISYRYVSRDIYGAGTLDRYGSWRYVLNIGFCWFPRVTASWVPYRHGRWIWLDYYGWTWVGNEPWGWAPYHWGRWHNHPLHGWGWFPGHPRLRHVWSPALVAFFGFEAISRPRVWAGFGGIGWAPLAPGEPFSPWYGSRYYGNSTIIVDRSIRVFNTYSNARDRRAVSYIDSRQFALGSNHTPRALRTGEIRTGVAIRGPLPVVPDRASQGTIRHASSSASGTSALRGLRRGYSHQLSDGTARIPFEDQRNRMKTSIEAFYKGYRSRATTVASTTGVRSPTGPAANGTPVGNGGSRRRVATASPDARPVSPTQAQRRTAVVASRTSRTASGHSNQTLGAGGTRKSIGTLPPSADARSPRDIGRSPSSLGQTRQAPTTVYSPTTRSSATTMPRRPSDRLGTAPATVGGARPGAQIRSPATAPVGAGPSRAGRVSESTPSALTRPAAVSTTTPAAGTPSSVYAPRARSRIGSSSRLPGRRPSATNGTSSRTASASQAKSPSRSVRVPDSPHTERNATFGNPSSVYAPRSRSRVGMSSNRGTQTRQTESRRAGSVYRRPTAPMQQSTRRSSRSTGMNDATSRTPAGSSTEVYSPRSGSRVGIYQLPRTSTRGTQPRNEPTA